MGEQSICSSTAYRNCFTKLSFGRVICQAIHNAEKGEPAALLLSPRTSSAMPGVESMGHGSQFTYFLTVPMQAFCQLAGITSNIDTVSSLFEDLTIRYFLKKSFPELDCAAWFSGYICKCREHTFLCFGRIRRNTLYFCWIKQCLGANFTRSISQTADSQVPCTYICHI